MTLWVTGVRRDNMAVAVFWNDRALRSRHPNGDQIVEDACRAGAVIDHRLGLCLSPGKTQLAARRGVQREKMERLFENDSKVTDKVVYLGLIHDLNSAASSKLKRHNVKKAEFTAARIQRLGRTPTEKAALIRSLLLPCWTWAAAHVDLEGLPTTLRRTISRSLLPRPPSGASAALIWHLYGELADPWLQYSWSALRAWGSHMRDLFDSSAWQDRACLKYTTADILRAAPGLRKVLNDVKCQWHPQTMSISRLDEQGETRILHVASDGIGAVRPWLVEEWRRYLAKGCERIRRRYNRHDPDFASGRDLVAPPTGRMLVTDAHNELRCSQEGPHAHNISLATGLSLAYCGQAMRVWGDGLRQRGEALHVRVAGAEPATLGMGLCCN